MPERNRNNGRTWLAALAAVVLLGGGWLWLSGAFAPWSFTKSVSVEPHGYFFRVKASYTHGDEPIEFDYVAVCGYRTTRYKDGSKSNDGTYDPKVMIKATSDGGALMIRTPRACSGQTTTNGKAPADLLPFIIWFDDVNDLTFGWGYASPDAYDSPHAQVRFHGATIEAATAEDWKAWRAKAEAEYEPKGMLPGPWGWSYPARKAGEPEPAANAIAWKCSGYIRLKIPEEVRARVREHWPSERPEFWAPKQSTIIPMLSWKSPDGAVHDVVYEAGGNRGDAYAFTARAVYGEEIGVPTRTGGGTLDRVRKHYPADTYPLLYQRRSLEQPVVAATDSRSRRLLERDDMKGFVTCGGAGPADDSAFGSDTVPREKRYSFFVNDTLVVVPGNGVFPPSWFFERDEYYYGEAPWS